MVDKVYQIKYIPVISWGLILMIAKLKDYQGDQEARNDLDDKYQI